MGKPERRRLSFVSFLFLCAVVIVATILLLGLIVIPRRSKEKLDEPKGNTAALCLKTIGRRTDGKAREGIKYFEKLLYYHHPAVGAAQIKNKENRQTNRSTILLYVLVEKIAIT